MAIVSPYGICLPNTLGVVAHPDACTIEGTHKNFLSKSDSWGDSAATAVAKSSGEIPFLDGLPATKVTVTSAAASGNGYLTDTYTPPDTDVDTFSVFARCPAGVSYTLNMVSFRFSDSATVAAGLKQITITENWQRFEYNFTPLDNTLHVLLFGNLTAFGITGTFGINVGEFIYVGGASLTHTATIRPYQSTGR